MSEVIRDDTSNAVPLNDWQGSVGASNDDSAWDAETRAEPVPQDGAVVLDEVLATVQNFIVWPDEHAAVAYTLWIAATHAQPAWEHATRFVLKSPIKRCGKTRAQEVGRELVNQPLSTTNISVAALVRSINEKNPPTLILDEADSIFGRRKDRPESAEDLRGILNSGHSRGWPYVRWDAASRSREDCDTFAMALIGGIGDVPDTIEDRAVIVSMRRRTPSEKVHPFRRRRTLPELHRLRNRLHAWVSSRAADLAQSEPDLPVQDRQADVWESFVAVADAAGGDWPDRSRKACEHFCDAVVVDASTSGELLLRDLHDVWSHRGDEEQLFTETILERLHKRTESPWNDWYGKPLTARGLAKLLRPYGVKSQNVRLGDSQAKGYHYADLADSWHRYVPSVPASQEDESPGERRDGSGTEEDSKSVPRSDQRKEPVWDAGTDGTDRRLQRAITFPDPRPSEASGTAAGAETPTPDRDDDLAAIAPDGQKVAEARAEEVRRRLKLPALSFRCSICRRPTETLKNGRCPECIQAAAR